MRVARDADFSGSAVLKEMITLFTASACALGVRVGVLVGVAVGVGVDVGDGVAVEV